MNKKFIAIVYLFSFLLVTFSSFAAVEVFSQYNTEIIVNSNNTVDIHKTIYLQNIHTVGIVPGSVEFKINKKINNSDSEIKVTNIRLYDRYNNPVKFTTVETNDHTVIKLDIFSPLLPGFEYKLEMFYTLNYEPSGIFFKSIEIPTKEINSIPIRNGSVKVILPENYGFTYINYENNSFIEKNTGTWEINNNLPSTLAFEYSYIPLKFGELKGSTWFWILIDLILLLLLVIEVTRRVKKNSDSED